MAAGKESFAFYEVSSWFHRVKVLQPDGSTKYSKRGGFATQEEAEKSYYKCEEEYRKAYRTYYAQSHKDFDFKEYLIYWLEEIYASRIENTTKALANFVLYDLILPNIGQSIKLKYVNAEYLDALLDVASTAFESAGNKGRELLNVAMKDAVELGYIKNNPVPMTKPYKRKKPHIQVLSKGKLKFFLTKAVDSPWYLEILLGLFCGLRKGEIYGLKFSDFDMEQEVVTISRQVTSNPIISEDGTSYRVAEKLPKTENSNRMLRVPEAVMKELRKRQDKINLDRQRLGAEYIDEGYISCRENGLPHSMAAFNTYVVYTNVKVADFLEYWLEGDIRNRVGSYNMYVSFSNAVHKHIILFMGKKKMADVNKGDVRRLYNDRAAFSVSIAKMIKTVMNVSFDYAVEMKIVSVNPAAGVELPKQVEKTAYHTRSLDGQRTLTMEQIQILLEASKDTPIHIMVLFNVLMGFRRQEILGLKYSDVDYINRTISVERQLGRAINTKKEDFAPKTFTKQEIQLKTSSSKRELPIPDYVFEAILKERKLYEKRRSRRKKKFQDLDYICCSSYGRPRSKDFHWKHYKKLLKDNELPDIRWHDLRSTFCTLLLKNDFSPKAVSKLMGHAKEVISVDAYGDNANIIPDEIPELLEFMDEVLPNEAGDTDMQLDIVADTSYYIT